MKERWCTGAGETEKKRIEKEKGEKKKKARK